MAKYIRPPAGASAVTQLRALYMNAEREIINEILRKRTRGYVDYAEVAALERVQTILQGMVDDTWEYVPTMIEKFFYKTEQAAKGYANARALTVTQSGIVDQLTNNLIGELTDAAETVMHSTRQLLATARLESDSYRNAALRGIAESQASGMGLANASKKMINQLNNSGITAFVDKSGREWGLREYANMAVRTTARQAEVAAVLTTDPDHDLYTIPAHGSSCGLCASFENRVYSRSGTDPNYPPLSLAFGKVDPSGSDDLSNTYLNIHPGCMHPLIRYTTQGKSAEQIHRDRDFSNPDKNPVDVDPRSKKQIEEYRQKEAARQKLLNNVRQYQRYKDTIGEGFPKTFQTFQKHKLDSSAKYEEWKKEYRRLNRQQKEG